MADIGVLIVDDQPVVRWGLNTEINQENGMKVVGKAESGCEAVKRAHELLPDVVVMDVEMRGMSGVTASRQILEIDPGIRVLAFSAHTDDELVFETIDAGVIGYILKSSSLAEVLESIRAVHSGNEVIGPAVAKSLINGALTRGRAGPGPDDLLSRRELEVMKLISDGFNLPDIAEKLGLRPSTVKTYNQRIMGKLDVHTRNELFKYAVRNKLVEVD